MNPNQSIPEVLERVAMLLSDYNEDSWARACRSHASAFSSDPKEVKGQIRSMYGGMVSFSDVVLHGSDGSIPRAENAELDDLRGRLFELCRASA